jgi:hypothetical protein
VAVDLTRAEGRQREYHGAPRGSVDARFGLCMDAMPSDAMGALEKLMGCIHTSMNPGSRRRRRRRRGRGRRGSRGRRRGRKRRRKQASREAAQQRRGDAGRRRTGMVSTTYGGASQRPAQQLSVFMKHWLAGGAT